MSTNRSFGIVFFIVFFIIAIFPLKNDGDLRIWSLVISIIFLLLGLLNSKILTPPNRLWSKFGILLGRVMSPLIMGLIFFLVVSPIGLIMRMLRKDLLNLKFDDNRTYWIKKRGPKSIMKNQF